jgi:ABC-type uncharacterized transport system YnjBCD substrate-binding protein
MTPDDQKKMEARIKELEAENASLKNGSNGISFAVSTKGGVSVYGLQHFPTTLYKDQWRKILTPENVEALLKFIEDNEDQLSSKK